MLAATQKRPLLLGQYKPSCDANGHFNSIQNHEGYYFCVDERGIPDFSTKSRNNNIKCSGNFLVNFLHDYVLVLKVHSEVLKVPITKLRCGNPLEEGTQSWNTGVLYCSDTSFTALNWAISESEKVPLNCIKYMYVQYKVEKNRAGGLM